MEDVAIAYGYNNIVKKVPQTVTAGAPQPLNKVTDLLRLEVANAGYTEILAFSLVCFLPSCPFFYFSLFYFIPSSLFFMSAKGTLGLHLLFSS